MVRTNEMDSKVIESLLADVKHLKNPELEIRFGHKDSSKAHFDSTIPFEQWSIVLKRLRSNPKWSSVSTTSFVDSVCKETRARYRSSEGKWITKKRIMVRDIPMEPMDVRVGLSDEVPFLENVPEKSTVQNVHKIRHRFVHKDIWAFDLTEATGYDIDQESPWYFIELELVPESLSRYPAKYVADYGILLIRDILSMVQK